MSNGIDPVDQNEIFQIFQKAGALLTGHFLLSSGLHSGTYFEKFQVLQYPQERSEKTFPGTHRVHAAGGQEKEPRG